MLVTLQLLISLLVLRPLLHLHTLHMGFLLQLWLPCLVLVCAIVCGIQSGMITAVGSLVDPDYESNEEDSDSDPDSNQPARKKRKRTGGTKMWENVQFRTHVMEVCQTNQNKQDATSLKAFPGAQPKVKNQTAWHDSRRHTLHKFRAPLSCWC